MLMARISDQKGRGIAEYAAILAFVVGVGVFLNSSDLGADIKATFAQATEYFRGGAYANALSEYGQMSNADLKQMDNDARIALDQEGITNLGKKFLGMSKSDLQKLFHTNENTLINGPSNNPFGVILLDYEVGNTGENGNEVTTTLRYNSGSFNSEDVLEWMKGNYEPDGSNTYNATHVASGRYLFSNDVIDKSGTANGTTPEGTHTGSLRGKFTFDSEGNVSSVTITATRSISKGGTWQRDVCEGLDHVTVTK